jgi:hypothetical protein
LTPNNKIANNFEHSEPENSNINNNNFDDSTTTHNQEGEILPNEEGEFTVESILGKRHYGREYQYHVK